MIRHINESLQNHHWTGTADFCWWAWHIGHRLYKCFLTQSGMLQCKFDVIMTTSICFPFQTYLIIARSLFSLKNTNIMTNSMNLASETVVHATVHSRFQFEKKIASMIVDKKCKMRGMQCWIRRLKNLYINVHQVV